MEVPLAFEPNRGQAAAEVDFVAHAGGYSVVLNAVSSAYADKDGRRFNIVLKGPNPRAVGQGTERQVGTSNYLKGQDPSRWVTSIPRYAGVTYKSIYPGIDLTYYATHDNVEHDFVVAPGADPKNIGLELQGAERMRRARNGDLVLISGEIEFRLKRPSAYQVRGSEREDVKVSYLLKGRDIRFALGPYDRARALVIDPVIVYSTYLGGAAAETAYGVALDAAGNTYVAGATSSTNFPLKDPLRGTCTGCTPNFYADVFVTKIDANGALVFSTYFGGSNNENVVGLGVDANGNAMIGGVTVSNDFPLVNSYTTRSGFNVTDAFLASIKSDGTALNYSTLVGGADFAYPKRMAFTTDTAGNAYLAGLTTQQAFPTTPGTLPKPAAGYPWDTLFAVKVDTTGMVLYSAMVAGTQPYTNYAFNSNYFRPIDIAATTDGSLVIVGYAGPGLPVTDGVVAPTFPGDATSAYTYAGFALKLNPTASAITFGTYLPGADTPSAVVLDGSENLYIAGTTNTASFTPTANAFQTQAKPGKYCLAPCNEGFVMKLDPAAAHITAATFLAGTPADSNANSTINVLAFDSYGNLVVGGATASADYPLKNPVRALRPSSQSVATVTTMLPDLTDIVFSTYLSGLNGSYHSNVYDLVTGPGGSVVVAGGVDDLDFPTTPDAVQPTDPTSVQNPHAFVTKIDTVNPGPAVCLSRTQFSFPGTLVNSSSTLTTSLSDCSNGDMHISAITASGTDFSQTNDCANPLSVGAACTITVVFHPSSNVFRMGSLQVQTDGGSYIFSLVGTGTAPSPLYPSPIVAPNALVGTAVPVFAPILNQGTGNLIVTNAVTTGDFSVTDASRCATLAPQSSCSIALSFAPSALGTRSGTLTVTDNSATSPHVVNLTGTAIDQYPVPTITSIPAVSTAAVTIRINGSNFFPASKVYWNYKPLTTTYVNPGQLAAAVSVSDVSSLGEIPVTVVNPAPGGGISNVAIATTYTLINQAATDVVYDPNAKLLYATVPASATDNANSLIALDPESASIVKTIPVNDPQKLALSADGKLAYVGLYTDGAVSQIDLVTGAVNFTVNLGVSTSGRKYVASALAVLPGAPHTWIIGTTEAGTCCGGVNVFVYDDQQPRPKILPTNYSVPYAAAFAFTTDPTKVYSTDSSSGHYLDTFSIDSTGVTFTDEHSGMAAPPLRSDGTYFYSSNGFISDPRIPSLVTTYTNPAGIIRALVPDPASKRLFAGAGSSLIAADLNSRQTLGSVPAIAGNSVLTDIFRWGTNGFMVRVGFGSPLMAFLRSSLSGVPAPVVSTISASPALVDFGSHLLFTPETKSVLLKNNSSAPEVIDSISTSGPFQYGGTDCPGTLSPGAICNLWITTPANQLGATTGAVDVTFHDGLLARIGLTDNVYDITVVLSRPVRPIRAGIEPVPLPSTTRLDVQTSSTTAAGTSRQVTVTPLLPHLPPAATGAHDSATAIKITSAALLQRHKRRLVAGRTTSELKDGVWNIQAGLECNSRAASDCTETAEAQVRERDGVVIKLTLGN